jgi:hypothetical protein
MAVLGVNRLAKRRVLVILAVLATASFARTTQAAPVAKRFIYQATFARRGDAEAFVTLLNSGTAFCDAGKSFGLNCQELELGEMTQSRFANISSAALARKAFQVDEGRAMGPVRTQFGWQVVEAAQPVDGPWFPIGRSEGGMTYELDTRSVSGDHSFRKAWIRYIEAPRNGVRDKVLSYEGFDCDGRQAVTIKSIRYRNGRALSSGKAIPESIVREFLEPVVPDTVGDTVHKLVCTFPDSAVRPQD